MDVTAAARYNSLQRGARREGEVIRRSSDLAYTDAVALPTHAAVKAADKEGDLRKRALILLGFGTAQVLDVVTTHIGLSEGRQELNGIAAWLIAHNGELTVYAAKFSIVTILLAFLLLVGRRRPSLWNAYLIAAWITTLAVVNNLYRILT